MNQHVAIPTSFFLNEAKHEYYDYKTRLVAELLQNSLDAGATVIRLTLSDTGYSCEDNGRGMSKERMVSALLTMGGSVKESGATGGFGAAKKLLLFAHQSFRIASNDTGVEGAGLGYKFVDVPFRQGTTVAAQFAPEFGSGIERKANEFLSKCDFKGRCKVYLNNNLFTAYATPSFSKSVENLGDLYGSKRRTANESIIVRHNGLFMFDRYITNLNRDVVIEVAGKSIDMFTQNRDGFRGDASRAFDLLVSELTINKESFVKAKPRKFVLPGAGAFINFVSHIGLTADIQKVVNDFRAVAANLSPGVVVAQLTAAITAQTTISEAAKMEAIATIVEAAKSNLQTDFHFDLADTSYRSVPPQFMPNVGKKKYTLLAQLWKVCLRETLKANGLNQNFIIGFTFDSNVVATHQKVEGVSRYLLNPTCDAVGLSNVQARVMTILTTAVHEIVHSQGCGQHDESFVLKFHELLTPTLCNAPTYRQLMKMAKVEKV